MDTEFAINRGPAKGKGSTEALVPEDKRRWISGLPGINWDDREIFTMSARGAPVWQAAVLFPPGGPFTASQIWSEANAVAVGAGAGVFLLDLWTGEERAVFDVDFYFGSFQLSPTGDALHIVGAQNIFKLGLNLGVLWKTPSFAVDGITFDRFIGSGTSNSLVVSAEMDPPGDWQEAVLDSATGRLLKVPVRSSSRCRE